MVASIEQYGQLEPALVTKQYEVINGQHRLMACKQLGKPFKYVLETAPEGGVSAVHIGAVNSAKNWGLKEYVQFYASQNDTRSVSYKYVEALKKEFNLNYDVIGSVINATGNGKKDMIAGQFTMDNLLYTIVRECLNTLFELKFNEFQAEAKLQKRPYWVAVTYAYRCPINLNRLIKKLNENMHRVPSTSRPVEYLEVFSEVYNKGLTKDKRIYLDTDYEKGLYRSWE